MEQIVFDRYNKGHNKHKARYYDSSKVCICGYYGYVDNYNFLYNSKWGWLETFEKDKDWQKEFWGWMIKKEYITREDVSTEDKNNWAYFMQGIDKMESVIPTKQMLVGYIKEFMEQFI